jgi:membrane-associated phospholipid phosphatase
VQHFNVQKNMPRSIAWFFSIIGHPMLVLTGVLWLMLLIHPYAFGVRQWSEQRAVILLFQIFFCSALLPIVGALLMRALGFAQSIQMDTTQERIGPYILTGVFYLWMAQNLLKNGQVPRLYVSFVIGATLALFVCFFINIFTKISAHAAGMGGFVVMLLMMALAWSGVSSTISIGYFSINWIILLIAGILLAGAVGTSRLVLGAHTPTDLYRGYLVGIGTMVLAWLWIS